MTRAISALGVPVMGGVSYVGALARLLVETCVWLGRGLVVPKVRIGRPAIYAQVVRLGVRPVGVVMLVQACIGMILALQMAPPLNDFGQTDLVANIIAIAVVRELGPLVCAIVMTGFAGAAVAAEIGTMVVGEEIEALRAHALNPTRFLVVPRVLSTVICLLVLTTLGIFTALIAGYAMGISVLGVPSSVYVSNTLDSLDIADLATGLFKTGVFGMLIGAIACYNGMSVTGGAAGVGKATTNTVVHSIVMIIFTDMLFVAMFYKLGWT
ncbi:MAG: ABC transporter permease [Phycisphaeraceae bacterium]|nr:ABC transporter permease [Phycisphaeraceae bacterium]